MGSSFSLTDESRDEIDDVLAAYHGMVLSQDIGAVLGVLAAVEADLADSDAARPQSARAIA